MDIGSLLSSRSREIDASGIRRVFDLGAKLKDPLNLSIGQPDFGVPEAIQDAAVDAIRSGRNGYTVTQGIGGLRHRVAGHLRTDLGWDIPERASDDTPSLMITSGTSGALLLAMLAILDPGDEIVIPDPYFVMYPHVARMAGAHAVRCDTYPDFRMTAGRVEPLITGRTKAVLVNSPSNPAGVVLSARECDELRTLCREKGVLLISDEIYDEFTYEDAREACADGVMRCPSPCRESGAHECTLLIRGFGKTYGLTGWRLGYAAGPRALLEEMGKLQQYTFVCAPSALQWGAVAALDVDMSAHVREYRSRRDLVVEKLSKVTDIATPGGAFYAFPRVPERLGLDASGFIDRCLERNVLVIPGNVFSSQDTHFRVSYATDRVSLERGLEALAELMGG